MPCPEETPYNLYLGQLIYFINDQRILHPAYIASILPAPEPILNMTILLPDGRFSFKRRKLHGTHNGELWIVLERWFLKEEFDSTPSLWSEVLETQPANRAGHFILQ
jgi:hypothetical protein